MDLNGAAVEAVMSAAAAAAIQKLVNGLPRKGGAVDPKHVTARLELYARGVSEVKTLLSTERAVPISHFYCAPSISIGTKQFLPKSSDSFYDDRVLIEGVVGQGKSTLLRWLCSNAILEQGRVALFFELRKLDHKVALTSIIMERLREFGLPANTESLKHLAVSRGLEIYLDGFDELSFKEAQKIDRDLDFLAATQHHARVFVTARPHVGLAKNSLLTTHKIRNLDRRDAFRLIDKLCPDQTTAEGIKAKLNAHGGAVSELLETPLLVTLLVAKYVQTTNIPEHLSDFYDSIFETLFERHDHFKVPYRRDRKLALSTAVYESVFRAFCFGSLLADKLLDGTALKIAEWAMRSMEIEADAGDFLIDISSTTSLITHEREAWYFIHTSIPEFFAARYLLSLTDAELTDWSGKLKDSRNSSAVKQVFRFASELDNYRFTRFVQIPYLGRVLSPIDAQSELCDDTLLAWLEAHEPRAEIDDARTTDGKFLTIYMSDDILPPIKLFVRSTDFADFQGCVEERNWVGFREAFLKVRYVRESGLKTLREGLQMLLNDFRDATERSANSAAAREQSLPALLGTLGTL